MVNNSDEGSKAKGSTLEKLLKIYGEVRGAYKFVQFQLQDRFSDQRIKETTAYGVISHMLEEDSHFREINYSQKDISKLVEAMQEKNLNNIESKAFGAYVGSLITILTRRNKKEGKCTIIEIEENKIDFLGYGCREFDVVKIGLNEGSCVFALAWYGNKLYVEDCEGSRFARFAGSDGGYVGEISANVVKGEGFAESAGSDFGHVDKISADFVNGDWFAAYAGDVGHVGKISAGTVNGLKFAYGAGCDYRRRCVGEISADRVNGKYFAECAKAEKIYVREISKGAKRTMNPETIIEGLEMSSASSAGGEAQKVQASK